jgi:ferredoxin
MPPDLRLFTEEPKVRVHVDRERCQGHNRCYALAPELFDVDDFGNAFELNDGLVPEGLEDKARRAAANCPEYAIEISE